MPKTKSRTFVHHETGWTIIRELNIPVSQIPEYHLPYDPKAEAPFLEVIVNYCLGDEDP